jgi:hypothetical protein
MSDLLYGRAGPEELRDPDFPVPGTVRYELHKALDGYRCCIKRVEVMGIFESREQARQWMIENHPAGS